MIGIFEFIKNAGEALADAIVGDANAAESVKQRVEQYDLGIDGLEATIEGDKVILTGTAASAEAAEKAILAAGNIEGIAQVESRLEIAEPAPQAQFYTVQSGDSLSKIAKEFYGDANRYMEIFEANRPMLSDPDKIYPGQSLRIPADAQSAAA